MSRKPVLALGLAALVGTVLVSASCTKSAPVDGAKAIQAFSECRAKGDLDGAFKALADCAKSHSNSVAIIRAAEVAEGLCLCGDYDAARAKAYLSFLDRLIAADVLTPTAVDVLRVRAFAALLRQDSEEGAFKYFKACSKTPETSADLVEEAERFLKRLDADKAPEAARRRLAFIEGMLKAGILVDSTADVLHVRVFSIRMKENDLDAALGAIASCGKEPETSRTINRAVRALVQKAPADKVLPTLEKLRACPWFRPADMVGQLTEDQFIRFAGDGGAKASDVARLKELLAFSEKLLAEQGLLTEAAANSLKERRLDGFFLSNDFDGAIDCLEKGGAPNHTAAWCKGTAAKLRAHKAMEAGDKKEAVKLLLVFGEFMLSDEQKDFEDCDPTTGIVYSREWVVARNYMRCSKMSRETGDAASADKYLAEAKKFFATAHEKAKEDQKSLETLRAEMKEDGLEVPALPVAKPADAKPQETKAPAAK